MLKKIIREIIREIKSIGLFILNIKLILLVFRLKIFHNIKIPKTGHNLVFFQIGDWNILEHFLFIVLSHKYNKVIAVGSITKIEQLYLYFIGIKYKDLKKFRSHKQHGKNNLQIIINNSLHKIYSNLSISTVSRKFRNSKTLWSNREKNAYKEQLKIQEVYTNAWFEFCESNNIKTVWYYDHAYLPIGWFITLSLCKLNHNIFNFNASHNNNKFILRKVTLDTINDQHLKKKIDYKEMKQKKFCLNKINKMKQYINNLYLSNTWYSEVGTAIASKEKLGSKYILSYQNMIEKRPIGIIFPHIVYDATSFAYKDVYKDYSEFLIRTLELASKNKDVFWFCKIHPANKVKFMRDFGENRQSIEEMIAKKYVASNDNIIIVGDKYKGTTLDLIKEAKFVVTVRGTVALEAGLFGKYAICAGESRFSGASFCYEAKSIKEYERLIQNAQNIKHDQILGMKEAENICEWQFKTKPFSFKSIVSGYKKDNFATQYTNFSPEFFDNIKEDVFLISNFVDSRNEHLCLKEEE